MPQTVTESGEDQAIYRKMHPNSLANLIHGERGQRKVGVKGSILNQARDMQRFAYKAAMALEKELKNDSGEIEFTRDEFGKICEAPAIAQVMRAYEIASDRLRIISGEPLPGVLKPATKQAKQRQSSTPSPIRRPQVVAFEQPQTPQDNSACGV